MMSNSEKHSAPLDNLEQWEDDLRRRYPKKEEEFRDYQSDARSTVREFYRLNHQYQTVEFVKQKRAQFLPLQQREMSILQAAEFLNTLVDDSDPDTDLPQIAHLMQTAEMIRHDNHPRWFILTGFIHDLGKILCLLGEPQWAVVGDTFPVGCRFSDRIVLPEFFSDNPDIENAQYQTACGRYQENCGLDNVLMSWGHDEYLYHVVKDNLPIEAQYIIRYHSFYAQHKENAYDHLLNDQDQKMFDWVRKFNPYDLYTKSHEPPDVEALLPFYEALIAEFFPPILKW